MLVLVLVLGVLFFTPTVEQLHCRPAWTSSRARGLPKLLEGSRGTEGTLVWRVQKKQKQMETFIEKGNTPRHDIFA